MQEWETVDLRELVRRTISKKQKSNLFKVTREHQGQIQKIQKGKKLLPVIIYICVTRYSLKIIQNSAEKGGGAALPLRTTP